MNAFSLKIVTPDGLKFDGEVTGVSVRAITGDLGILAGHAPLVAPLGMGRAVVNMADGTRRYGACIGGMVTVMNGSVTLVPTTFEWAEDIDVARVEQSVQWANAVLADANASKTDLALAQARLRRALVRQSVAEKK